MIDAEIAWEPYLASATDETEHTVVGTLLVGRDIHSPQLANQRDVYVYLPPSYNTSERHYPVLYMHDGQNLFDQATSFAGEWRVDETMEALSTSGYEAIVVGIANTGVSRIDEYSPFPDRRAGGGGKGNAYLDWLVDTLKPQIDGAFRTLPARKHTGILGSSMGGLISLYAFFRHFDTFGFVGALSPSLWFGRRAIFSWLLDRPLVGGTIYLDGGTREGRSMSRDLRDMGQLLLDKGYTLDRDLWYSEIKHGTHSEAAWADRLHVPITRWLQSLS